jgi:tetratricopeptide (TPR) repeat protein
MKKKMYLILIATTIISLEGILVFSKKKNTDLPKFKNRSAAIANTGEWLNAKKAIEGLLQAIAQNPQDYKAMLSLSQAYIQEGRITGDHNFYDKAALELLDKIVIAEPNNFDALCAKATVLLSQHHFEEALQLANRALPLNKNNATIYGILCDANLELGNYDAAIKMGDKMISIRPDIRSYARISYLREIHGDHQGAIFAAKLATEAGYPGLEQSEWTRCILAHLYENKASLDSAEYQYNMALNYRPNYAFALAGLGRVAKAKGNFKSAIQYYEKAKSIVTEYSFIDELTDLYALNKEKEKSEKNAQLVIDMLSPNTGDESEQGHGHYADKELAYAYLKLNDTVNAQIHAEIEYQRRPENIEVLETIAWVKYKSGQYVSANTYINRALRTNYSNPIFLFRVGLIKAKANEIEKGKYFIKKALELNPVLDVNLRQLASADLLPV